MTESKLLEIHKQIIDRQGMYWKRVPDRKYLDFHRVVAKLSGALWWRYLYTLDKYGFEVRKRK